jgi:hypothetical protein
MSPYGARDQAAAVIVDCRSECFKEWDDGSFTYTRDVYAFGAIVLYCLTDVELKSYDDIRRAVEEFDVPDEVGVILRRCLSDDPGERFSNAIVLLEDIDRVQQQRAEHWAEIPHISFSLPIGRWRRFGWHFLMSLMQVSSSL